MIILDLGGVVFKEAEFFVYDSLPEQIKQTIPEEYKQRRIFLRAFDFANLITGKDLTRDWLFGVISGDAVATIIADNIDKPEFDSFFKSAHEKVLIKYGADMMLNPKKLVYYGHLYPQALEFIQQCHKNGIRVLILSNWDPGSFDMLAQTYPEIFSLIPERDRFIPAHTGFRKPEKEAYDYLLEKTGLRPEICIFIDDSKKNIDAAQKCGVKGILHTSWDDTLAQIQALL